MARKLRSTKEGLARIKDDRGLARFVRTGHGPHKLADFKVAERRELLSGTKRAGRYQAFLVPKRSGGQRTIQAPDYRLKTVQGPIASALTDISRPTAPCHGYVRGRGPLTNAKVHVGQRWVLSIDLEDCFPSVHLGRIRGVLIGPPFGLPWDVANMLAILCTYPMRPYKTELPQGAPTSPMLSNLVCRSLDRDLLELARNYRCYYTRGADDITISTDRGKFPSALADLRDGRCYLGDELREIIERHSFVVREDKARLAPRTTRQRVTGIVINTKPNVTRKHIMDLKGAIHCLQMKGPEETQRRFVAKYDKKYRPGESSP